MPAQMSWRRALRSAGYLAGLAAVFGGVRQSVSFAQGRTGEGQSVSQETPIGIRDLFPAEKIPFSAPPAFMLASDMRCSLKGNIYFVYSDAPELVLGQPNAISTLPISKLSIDSKTITQYQVPPISGYRGVLRLDFDVVPDGRVYALLTALKESDEKDKSRPAYFIAKFKDDGSVDSYFKLGDAPAGRIQPLRFAMFRDGSLLVTGTAVEGEQLHAFTAVMDRSGIYATAIKLPHDVGPIPLGAGPGGGQERGGQGAASSASEGDPQEAKEHAAAGRRKAEASPVSAVSGGSMITAPDGNVYLLRATDPARLYVLSPAGEVVRQFEVSSPAPGLTPTDMGMAGQDNIFIRFAHIATSSADFGQVPDLISVLSPHTGEVAAVYRLATGEGAFNLAACAASPNNFLFVGATDDGKYLQVTRYVAR